MKTEIIYEDKDIMVVRKPAGLATQTAKVGQPDVVSELKIICGSRTLGSFIVWTSRWRDCLCLPKTGMPPRD